MGSQSLFTSGPDRRNAVLETKSVIFRVGIGLLLIAALHILCFEYLSDPGANRDIGKQLGNISVQQQQASDSISRAATGADTAEKRITESIKNADTITDGLTKLQVESDDCAEIIRDSAERIRLCLAVIQEARAQRDQTAPST